LVLIRGLIFVIVIETLPREFEEGLPMELLYADYLVLMAAADGKDSNWKKSVEEKRLAVNLGKTKLMKYEAIIEPTEN